MSFFVRERPSNEKHYKYIFGERALFSPKKTDFAFSEVLKDFSKFYDLPYTERLKIAEKYDISTFYIFLDKEKELIFGVDFVKSSEVEENLIEVLKCTPKDIFNFVPKNEHTKRYFEEYQKKYFEEDEEIIFFEWFLKRFKNNSFDFEQYLIDYWNQMSIDNFPEEYLTKTISDLKGQIEEGILKNSDNYFKDENRFFLFGAEKFKRGTEMPFNGYLLELYFYWRATAKPAYFNESLTYLVTGYQRAKFYKFLIEQQKRLLKGEDITKPFEVEEVKKETITINIELYQIIEDLRKVPSLKRGIKPYLALFTYYLNESNKIQPRLISEKDIIDFSEKLFQKRGSSFKNLYSKMKNQNDARIKQLDLLKNTNEGLEIYKKYFDLIKNAN